MYLPFFNLVLRSDKFSLPSSLFWLDLDECFIFRAKTLLDIKCNMWHIADLPWPKSAKPLKRVSGKYDLNTLHSEWSAIYMESLRDGIKAREKVRDMWWKSIEALEEVKKKRRRRRRGGPPRWPWRWSPTRWWTPPSTLGSTSVTTGNYLYHTNTKSV